MSPITPTTKQARKDCQYTAAERAIIGKYKAEYREQSTKELRKQVMEEKILPDIFNYWSEERGGQLLSEEESKPRVMALAAYIRNNWRPLSTTAVQKAHVLRMSPIELVWELHKSAVEEELKKMLGSTSIDKFQQESFEKRTTACKNILDAMSIADRAAFDSTLEERRLHGNPPTTQRLRAEKHGDEAIRKWAVERWMDMGMSTVIFTIHTDSQGRLVADCQEDVAKRMGVNAQRFSDRYQAQVSEMKRHLLEYAKSMRTRQEAAASGIAGAEAGTVGGVGGNDTGSGIDIVLTNRGFPRLPAEVMDDLTKKQWELLMRKYLSRHYSLASGHLSRHVPYEQVKKSTRRFVASEHMPHNLTIQDPRNMHKEDIARLLRHVYERQEKDGTENSFRFKVFIGKEKDFLSAVYPQIPTQSNQAAATGASTVRSPAVARPGAAATGTHRTGAAGTLGSEAAAGTDRSGAAETAAARTAETEAGLDTAIGIGDSGTDTARPGAAGSGAARSGAAGAGTAGEGAAGEGAAGAGAAGSREAGRSVTGTGTVGTEAAGAYAASSVAAGTEAAGSGEAGTGEARTGAAGTDAAGTDAAETGAAGTRAARTGAAESGAAGAAAAVSRDQGMDAAGSGAAGREANGSSGNNNDAGDGLGETGRKRTKRKNRQTQVLTQSTSQAPVSRQTRSTTAAANIEGRMTRTRAAQAAKG